MKAHKSIRLVSLVVILIVLAALWPLRARLVAYGISGVRQLRGEQMRSVEDRLAEFGDVARNRWKPFFDFAGASYPPSRVVLVSLKDVDVLEVYGANVGRQPVLLRRIKVLAASGEMGPKLREGDGQVPEGAYPIESLNPNSRFHVALRIGYPNAFDREKARQDGRQNLGGDIVIHGGAASVGCLAVGNEAAEDLFVLASDCEITNVLILISPTDLRAKPLPDRGVPLPSWYGELTGKLRQELSKLPR